MKRLFAVVVLSFELGVLLDEAAGKPPNMDPPV